MAARDGRPEAVTEEKSADGIAREGGPDAVACPGPLSVAAWSWVAVGAILRLGRAFCRWDEPVFDYAAYHRPFQSALAAGDLTGALGRFSGLHPPLYSLFFSLIDALYPAPLAWILASTLLSGAAVWLTAQAAGLEAGPGAATVAAAWMAVAPVQLAYAAEVNDYPLLAAVVAALLWTAARFRAGKGRWPAVVAAGVLAAWTHVLGSVAAIVVLAMAGGSRRRALGGLGAWALLCAPLAVPIMRLAGEASTYRQPTWTLEARAVLLWTRFGWGGLVTSGLAGLGAAVGWSVGLSRLALAVLGALIAVLGVFLGLHVAAPHQFPYLVALGPPAALLAAFGAARALPTPPAALPAPDRSRSPALPAPARSRSPALPAPARSRSPALLAPARSRSPALLAPDRSQSPALPAPDRSRSPALPAPDRSRSPALLVLLLLAGVGMTGAGQEARALSGVWRDQGKPRAIDAALASAHSGDALWLITPYQADDDKRLTSPVLWRMPPWEPMPAARPFDFDPADFHYGTPRVWRKLTVYLFTRIFPGPMRSIVAHHAAQHQAIRIVLYDGGREPGLQRELEAFLGSLGARVTVRELEGGSGGDRFYLLEGTP